MSDPPVSTTANDDSQPPSQPVKGILKKPSIPNLQFSENPNNNNGNNDDEESSPIAASMLGLNTIRTRSVPSNLLIPSLLGSDLKENDKDDKCEKKENFVHRTKFIVPDNTFPSPEHMGKKVSWGHTKGIKFPSPVNIGFEAHAALAKEMQSPRFQAILRVTRGRKKKKPYVKSFSHEFNSKGVCAYPFMRSRAFGHVEEFMVMIRAKFDKLKDEVNSDLGIFAGDLVDTLENSTEPGTDWREGLEDLLLVARKCEKMTTDEFWSLCEAIVQDLDDHRQDLPMGTLKRAHTRLLFILTRCTRLVHLQHESGYEEEHILNLHKLSDLGVYPEHIIEAATVEASDTLVKKDTSENLQNNKSQQQHNCTDEEPDTAKSNDSSPSSCRISSWKKFPLAAVKHPKKDSVTSDSPAKTLSGATQQKDELEGTLGSCAGNIEPSSVQRISWGMWSDQQHITYENLIICRICEVEIPAVFVEEHSRICTIADRCDLKGLPVNERLERVAETLERILESWTPKSTSTRVSTSSTPEELDELSPKKNCFPCELSDEIADCIPEGDNCFVSDEMNAMSRISCETRSSVEISKGNSSAGSLTPRSPLTPRTSQIELLLHKRKTISEHENNLQIKKLLDIARAVANINWREYSALEHMINCLEELKYSIQDRKVDALVVETFGRRIEKLLQEKYLQLYGQIDDGKMDSSHSVDEKSSVEDDPVRSFRASPINLSTKDRTSIEDFEIIKPISRGAYGRVFLARKRATGDLFAIKVLQKADMIRKNAVESILAERNILMTARNPFVVRFYYSFTCKDNLYLVMEYLNGGDLYSLLRNLGCLDEDMARVYVAEVVLALEYLHKLNVVHRDLKPDNLLISHDGHIKLTDFGLSKVGLINSTDDLSGSSTSSSTILADEKTDSAMKQQSKPVQQKHAVGTPDYLAPEILLGMGHGATADWWSVGVILFELVVGIPPFNAENPQIIFDNIMNHDIPWPKVPDEMSYEAYDFINQLLIENPVQRLGATGAQEVKQHVFFKDINWDTLARQKAMFVPSTEGAFDTSYFMSRYVWNPEEDNVFGASDFDMSASCSDSCSSETFSNTADEDGDECGNLAEFGGRNLAVEYSFSNFSFKNLSNLASINYDMVVKNNKDGQDQSDPSVQ